jgi:hypothetical protein
VAFSGRWTQLASLRRAFSQNGIFDFEIREKIQPFGFLQFVKRVKSLFILKIISEKQPKQSDSSLNEKCKISSFENSFLKITLCDENFLAELLL